MKKIILLAVLFACIRLGAQTTFSTSSAVINYLKGNWGWYRSCGGFAFGCHGPATVGYTRGMVFSAINGVNDSIGYTAYKNGALTHSGVTKIVPGVGPGGGNWQLESVQDEHSFPLNLAIVGNKTDSVWLMEYCGDCYTHIYYRDGTVGTDEISAPSGRVHLFPVPAHEQIHLELENADQVEKISFFSITGQEISLPALGKRRLQRFRASKWGLFAESCHKIGGVLVKIPEAVKKRLALIF